MDVFSEVRLSRGLDAVRAVAEVYLVKIKGEYLIFREVLFFLEMVLSEERKKLLATCWVMVEPPWTTFPANMFLNMARRMEM